MHVQGTCVHDLRCDLDGNADFVPDHFEESGSIGRFSKDCCGHRSKLCGTECLRSFFILDQNVSILLL